MNINYNPVCAFCKKDITDIVAPEEDVEFWDGPSALVWCNDEHFEDYMETVC